MSAEEWILKLKQAGILSEGIKNGCQYLHLKTPCKIHLSHSVTKQLRDNYDSKNEKGGVFVALPEKIGNDTHLKISKVIFITNVSENPWNSYIADTIELQQALNDSLNDKHTKYLPLRFHTHPTHSDNPVNEIFNYIFQSNTSQQDQLVSDTPIPIDDINILMPRSIVLCSGKNTDKMFIGFYNGLIAPLEFDMHRKEQSQKALESILNGVVDWSKEGNNKWWIAGGGLMLALLIIRYNKFAIPLILLLVAMIPMFINDQHGQPKYFAQIRNGNVTIDIP